MSARAQSSWFSYDILITDSTDIHMNRNRMDNCTNHTCNRMTEGTDSPISDCSKYLQ